MESCTFNWNFAKWDLRNMMDEINVVSSSLEGISSKMVYRYTYDPELVEHGCVRVQIQDQHLLGKATLEKRSGRPLCEWIGR